MVVAVEEEDVVMMRRQRSRRSRSSLLSSFFADRQLPIGARRVICACDVNIRVLLEAVG